MVVAEVAKEEPEEVNFCRIRDFCVMDIKCV